MMARAVPFDLVTRLMTLHFVTRQIYAGSGRVGIGENSEIPGYQLSQRADYIHAKVGLQTTFERPIINTRRIPLPPMHTAVCTSSSATPIHWRCRRH